MTRTPLPCHSCGKPGRVWKRTTTPSGRLRLIMICWNPACRFEFTTFFEGNKAKCQPKWSHVP